MEKTNKKKKDTTNKRMKKEQRELEEKLDELHNTYDERVNRYKEGRAAYNREAVYLMREHWKETAQYLQSKKDKEREIYNRLMEYYDSNSGVKAAEMLKKAQEFVAQIEAAHVKNREIR